MLRDAARQWVGDAGPVEPDPRTARSGIGARWEAIAGLGWAGACVAEASGGLGFGPAATGALLEALGGTLSTTPLLSTGLIAAQALADRRDLASAIAAGEWVVAFAIDEGPRHGAPIATRAERDDAGWRLTGAKRFVLDAPRANRLLVTAQTADGRDLFLVDAAATTIAALDMIDGREIGDVAFDCAPGVPLGVGVEGIDRLCDLARTGLASEMLGAADGALRTTVDYLKLREQFGRPIGSFQALQHRAAQALCEIELARSSVAAAWTAAEHGTPDFPALAALAKYVAGEAIHRVSSEMVQMHGGIGMTAEHPAGRTLKWARVSETLFGNAAWCAERYATLRGF
nr:acyl-CoA dehydrogenase [Sphingomonas chungangi]